MKVRAHFGRVGQLTGTSRRSIVSLVLFFTLGALLLWRVDVEEGIRVARREDEAEESKSG